eukprot:5669351-Prymnesium_polylepis.1
MRGREVGVCDGWGKGEVAGSERPALGVCGPCGVRRSGDADLSAPPRPRSRNLRVRTLVPSVSRKYDRIHTGLSHTRRWEPPSSSQTPMHHPALFLAESRLAHTRASILLFLPVFARSLGRLESGRRLSRFLPFCSCSPGPRTAGTTPAYSWWNTQRFQQTSASYKDEKKKKNTVQSVSGINKTGFWRLAV